MNTEPRDRQTELCLDLCFSVLSVAFLLATRCGACARNDSENFILAHNQQFLTVDFDFGAAVLAKKNSVALFNVQWLARSVLFVLSQSGRDYFTFLRFFLRAVGDDDAAANLLAFVNAFQ